MECLKLQISFCKRATHYGTLLRKTIYKNKASYASSPPCITSGISAVGLRFDVGWQHFPHQELVAKSTVLEICLFVCHGFVGGCVTCIVNPFSLSTRRGSLSLVTNVYIYIYM